MTTKEETLRRIAVMQAWCEGEKIEALNHRSSEEWAVATACPVWNWYAFDYRIAPKPKRRVKFLAYTDDRGVLFHSSAPAVAAGCKRVQSLDLEAEVDD